MTGFCNYRKAQNFLACWNIFFSSKEGFRWVQSVSQPKHSSAPVGTAMHCRSSLLLPWLLLYMKLCMCLIRRSERLLFPLYWQKGWVVGGGLFSRLVLMSAPRVCWSTSVRFQLNAHRYQRGFNHKRTDNTQHTITCFGGKQRGTPNALLADILLCRSWTRYSQV